MHNQNPLQTYQDTATAKLEQAYEIGRNGHELNTPILVTALTTAARTLVVAELNQARADVGSMRLTREAIRELLTDRIASYKEKIDFTSGDPEESFGDHYNGGM